MFVLFLCLHYQAGCGALAVYVSGAVYIRTEREDAETLPTLWHSR